MNVERNRVDTIVFEIVFLLLKKLTARLPEYFRNK